MQKDEDIQNILFMVALRQKIWKCRYWNKLQYKDKIQFSMLQTPVTQ